MRKALAAVFWTGLFLLMLSALVVSPDDVAAASIPPPPPAAFQAVMLPPDAPQPACSAGVSAEAEGRAQAFFLPAVFAQTASCAVTCDSNGRVLTRVRYENSVYQVFRAGVAGG